MRGVGRMNDGTQNEKLLKTIVDDIVEREKRQDEEDFQRIKDVESFVGELFGIGMNLVGTRQSDD